MNPTLKEKALQWFASGQDYKTGLQLLVEAGKTPMARIMANRAHRYAHKLAYELRRLAGEQAPSPKPQDPSPKPQIPSPKKQPANLTDLTDLTDLIDIKQQTTNKKQRTKTPEPKTPSEPLKPSKSLPEATEPVIARNEATKEHARLFRLRSQLAEQRQSIPQTNTPENNKKRRVLSQSIHELSDKIEHLFQTRHCEERSNQPSVAEPVEAPSLQPSQSSKSLQQQISNLQKAIQKDQTMLLYQQQKKLDKPNPMPKGEKRTKLEQRITLRTKQLQELKAKMKNEK